VDLLHSTCISVIWLVNHHITDIFIFQNIFLVGVCQQRIKENTHKWNKKVEQKVNGCQISWNIYCVSWWIYCSALLSKKQKSACTINYICVSFHLCLGLHQRLCTHKLILKTLINKMAKTHFSESASVNHVTF